MLKAFLFDLDGTLWDSKAAILESLKETITLSKGKSIGEKETAKRLGALDSPFEVLKSYGINRNYLFWKEYKKRYDLVVLFFDNTQAVLQDLANQGKKLGIVTSLKKTIALDLLNKFNLLSRFSVMITPSETSARKPSPKPILKAMCNLNLSKSEVIYIGDKDTDIVAAKRAGCYSGLANWGNGRKVSETPDYTFQEFKDLISLCDVR